MRFKKKEKKKNAIRKGKGEQGGITRWESKVGEQGGRARKTIAAKRRKKRRKVRGEGGVGESWRLAVM